MIKKNKNKIIAILMLVTIVFSSMQNIVMAKQVGDSAHLYSLGRCDYNVKFNFSGSWNYIICNYIVYEENGRTHPAYCVNKDLPRS